MTIDKMIHLSREKEDILGQILELTKEQKIHISNEDMEGINKLIGNKEDLMKKVDLLDLDFLSLYNRIIEEEKISSINDIDLVKYSNMEDLQDSIRDINILLEKISLLDKENTEIMEKNFNNIKSGLKHVKRVKTAYKGYNYEVDNSILLDEKK